MPAPKAPPNADEAKAETFYNVKQATVRLNLATEAEDDKRGQKWLRDGVNKRGFPHHRMAGQLLFSESNLAVIAELHENAATTRGKHTRRRTPRKRAATVPAQQRPATT